MRRRALDLLARREHSVTELRDKLRAKAVGDDETREAVLNALIAEGLLSDRRFAEACVRSRQERGQGPLRIRRELDRCGVDRELSVALLEDAGFDWSGLAREARRKRFGETGPGEYSERARQARFLRSRGFTESQIRAALGDDEWI